VKRGNSRFENLESTEKFTKKEHKQRHTAIKNRCQVARRGVEKQLERWEVKKKGRHSRREKSKLVEREKKSDRQKR